MFLKRIMFENSRWVWHLDEPDQTVRVQLTDLPEATDIFRINLLSLPLHVCSICNISVILWLLSQSVGFLYCQSHVQVGGRSSFLQILNFVKRLSSLYLSILSLSFHPLSFFPSVSVSRSVGRWRLRSVDSQTDELEGKPGALWQYGWLLMFLHLWLLFHDVLSVVLVHICAVGDLPDVNWLFSLSDRQSDDPSHQLWDSLVSHHVSPLLSSHCSSEQSETSS